MAPKKIDGTPKKGKGKGKQQETITSINEEWYVEMQYIDGVLIGNEWESHLRKLTVSDYNHHTNVTQKEMTLDLVCLKNKRTPECMPI